VTASSSQF